MTLILTGKDFGTFDFDLLNDILSLFSGIIEYIFVGSTDNHIRNESFKGLCVVRLTFGPFGQSNGNGQR